MSFPPPISPTDGSAAAAGAPNLAGWALARYESVETTQTLARAQPAWHAVLAEEQRSGRGQRERTFVSDRGGLYLSAVLPYAGDPMRARGFALAVGWAVREALRALGATELRLRWPNDLMIGPRKVGGILVEQGARDTLVVGIGLNVTNQPWRAAPELREIVSSLEECMGKALPDRATLAAALLAAVRHAHELFAREGFAGMVTRLNASWGEPRAVALELTGSTAVLRGVFAGITPAGEVDILAADGARTRVPEHHIARLREVV